MTASVNFFILWAVILGMELTKIVKKAYMKGYQRKKSFSKEKLLIEIFKEVLYCDVFSIFIEVAIVSFTVLS